MSLPVQEEDARTCPAAVVPVLGVEQLKSNTPGTKQRLLMQCWSAAQPDAGEADRMPGQDSLDSLGFQLPVLTLQQKQDRQHSSRSAHASHQSWAKVGQRHS